MYEMQRPRAVTSRSALRLLGGRRFRQPVPPLQTPWLVSVSAFRPDPGIAPWITLDYSGAGIRCGRERISIAPRAPRARGSSKHFKILSRTAAMAQAA